MEDYRPTVFTADDDIAFSFFGSGLAEVTTTLAVDRPRHTISGRLNSSLRQLCCYLKALISRAA